MREPNMTHTTTITYRFTTTPNPPTASVIESYRDMRLAALRTDPECSSSTYKREAAFPEETWRERLTGSGKATIVALASTGVGEEGDEEGSGGYVGTMTVIAGRNVRGGAVPCGADAAKTYFVYSMWVWPEHRRRGVGRRLMERMLAWARDDAKESTTGERDRDAGGFEAWLSARPSKEAARKLYIELGFREIEGGLEGHGELWMRRVLEEA